MKKSDPLISIIMPVFNLSGYISETLESVLSQTYNNFELLVIDDASTDDSRAIIESYQSKDNRIKLLSNTHNKGVSGARNTGVDRARGEWLAFLDGDDLWTADSLLLRYKALEKHPDARLVSCDLTPFEKDTSLVGPSNATTNEVWNKYFGNSLKTGELLCIEKPLKHFLQAALVHTGTVFVKTDIVKKIGGFDESLCNGEDTQLWLKIAANIKQFVFVPKVLMFYRQRTGSLTKSKRSMFHDAPRAYRDLLNMPGFEEYNKEILDNICHYTKLNSFAYRRNKNYSQALIWSLKLVLCDPLSPTSWKNLLASCALK